MKQQQQSLVPLCDRDQSNIKTYKFIVVMIKMMTKKREIEKKKEKIEKQKTKEVT